MAGTVANVIGFLLVVVALRFGPLALVEPLGPCHLIFASLINGYLKKLWDPVIVAGVVACTAGVIGFLAIARPSGGRSEVSLSAALPLLAGVAVLLAACLAVARWDRRMRPLALALACGIAYGVTDFCLKLVTSEFGHGLSHLFVHWRSTQSPASARSASCSTRTPFSKAPCSPRSWRSSPSAIRLSRSRLPACCWTST